MRKTGATKENTEAWVRLYNEGKSIRAIAKEYNTMKTCVSRAIKPFVEIRPKSPFLKYGEEWAELYLSGVSKSDIARQYNVSDPVVGNILLKMGIEKNPRTLLYEHLEETFIEMYKDGKSLREIGDKFGINGQTVLNYLKRNGIETRDLSEASRSIPFNEAYFDDMNSEKRFILGIIYWVGNIVYDGLNPRHLVITSQSKELIQYLQNMIDRDRGGHVAIRDEKYYFDEIHSIKFVSKITGFGFHSYRDFSFPDFNIEELDEFLDGYISPAILYGVMGKSQWFFFPSTEIKNTVLDYFGRKEMFSRADIKKETDTSFIIERKSFNKKNTGILSRTNVKAYKKEPVRVLFHLKY